MKKMYSRVSQVRFGLLALTSLVCVQSWANDEPLPEDMLLSNLPSSARMIVKKPMNTVRAYDRNMVSFDGQTVYEDIIGSSHICYSNQVNCFNTASFPYLSLMYHHSLDVGEVFSIEYSPPSSDNSLFGLNGYVLKSGVKTDDYLGFDFPSRTRNQTPRTIGDFNKLTNYTFQFVYDDPNKFELYPGMDKEVALDIEMKKITDLLKVSKYEEAIPRFHRVFKALKADGVDEDELLVYYYVFTLDKAGRKGDASRAANIYLKTYGKQSAHYKEVIEIASK
jgi:hypothetical protein